MWTDIIIGVFAGVLLGALLKPVYIFCVKNSTYLLARKLKAPTPLILLSNLIAAIILFLLFLSILLVKDFVFVWNNFLLGFLIGFTIGCFLHLLFARRGIIKSGV